MSKCYCIVCTKDYLPFSNLINKGRILTDKDKKLKLTHVALKNVLNKPKFLKHINPKLTHLV